MQAQEAGTITAVLSRGVYCSCRSETLPRCPPCEGITTIPSSFHHLCNIRILEEEHLFGPVYWMLGRTQERRTCPFWFLVSVVGDELLPPTMKQVGRWKVE